MLLEAGTDCTVKAAVGSTLYLAGRIKDESFFSTLCKSTADYTIKSSGANATLQADNLEARVFGGSLAHVRAGATKLESTYGKTDVFFFLPPRLVKTPVLTLSIRSARERKNTVRT